MPVTEEFGPFAQTICNQKYAHDRGAGKETWGHISRRVAKNVLGAVEAPKSIVDELTRLIRLRKFIPGGRYLYAAGRPYHQTQNCILMRALDSREGWAETLHNASMALMSGAGIGVDYSQVRPEGSRIRKTGGTATGPLALMQMVNEAGRYIMQGGSRRSAIWAGLSWKHDDIFKFIRLKDWKAEIRALKNKDFNFPATLDGTNISVILDDEFFEAYGNSNHRLNERAHDVYWQTLSRMLKTAEPGFSVDTGPKSGESLRNACTEITSCDDSDVCNLGSINMARIESKEEMEQVVDLATYFLLAGTVYSDVPYAKIDQMRTKNRRLGLGLMGIHEWLLVNGKSYGPDDELGDYLEIYRDCSKEAAWKNADSLSLSRPVGRTAIAPNGTIGIMGETTTSAEPMLCAAYKRRFLRGSTWHYQYVADPTAVRLHKAGFKVDEVEDAYKLAEDPGRRVAFQAWLQKYVDHGISSTVNLPSWGTKHNNKETVEPFGDMLVGYLPQLRGVTCYPNGARGGQPLTPIKWDTAVRHRDEVFVEQIDVCDFTKGSSCGE